MSGIERRKCILHKYNVVIAHQWNEYFLWDIRSYELFKTGALGGMPRGIQENWHVPLGLDWPFLTNNLIQNSDWGKEILPRIKKWYDADAGAGRLKDALDIYDRDIDYSNALWTYESRVAVPVFREKLDELQSKCETIVYDIRKLFYALWDAERVLENSRNILKKWFISTEAKAKAETDVAEYPIKIRALYEEFIALLEEVDKMRSFILNQ